MSIKRLFFDWSQPLLPQVAEWLAAKNPDGTVLDLRGMTVVLPGGRALRRLTELLVERATTRGLRLILPKLLTTGQLPEVLYTGEYREATSFERHMCWLQVLQRTDDEVLQPLIPKPPARNSIFPWFRLAQRLDALYADVAAGNLSFGDVAAHCASTDAAFADERWEILAQMADDFQETLHSHQLADVHAARKTAIEEERCSLDDELVLIGTSDLNTSTRAMLSVLRTPITAIIHAPDSEANSFDEHGCVLVRAWKDRLIPIADSLLNFSRSPSEQGVEILSEIQNLGGQHSADEITIGSAAKDATPFIIEALSTHGLPARESSGHVVSRTLPFSLLRLAAEYLQNRSFSALASLVRHPTVHAAVLRSKELKTNLRGGSLLAALDAYQTEHLQYELASDAPGARAYGAIPTLTLKAVDSLLGELLGHPRTLKLWTPEIIRALLTLFGATPLHLETPADVLVLKACEALHEELAQMYSIAPARDILISGAEAIRLLLSQVGSRPVQTDSAEDAIEILGWLELQLDDAPVLLISNMNESYVPENVNADPFLPNSLRAALGLVDNDRRFCRDSYALTAITHSRKHLRLFATRLDSQGAPLNLSRLLLRGPETTAARRLQAFFESTAEVRENNIDTAPATTIPMPPMPELLSVPPSEMSVTSFKDYLTCPYRFYLRHILKLRVLDDDVLELDAAASGTLVHAVLTAFGQSAIAKETVPDRIEQFLLDTLAQKFDETFGRNALATLYVQRLQTEARLKAFAAWQAHWASQGWEIRHTELAVSSEDAYLTLDSAKRMGIRGRIDRIDFNARTSEWHVFDYKTGDRGDHPEKTHRRGAEWVDLQLPLYRHILRQKGFEGPIQLGFIVLPADSKKTQALECEWSEAEYEQALSTAKLIAENVHNQVFWPPKQLVSTQYDDFRLIVAQDFDLFGENRESES